MSHVLALDIGGKRTGVAHADPQDGIPLSLPTIHHATTDALRGEILDLIDRYQVTHIVIGLPLLPSGEEGSQALIVRDVLKELRFPSSLVVTLQDERYTTPRDKSADPDSESAVALLEVFLQRGIF